MNIVLLGRQPQLGMAELESIYGTDQVSWFSKESAIVKTSTLLLNQLGGSFKAGKIVSELIGDWSTASKKIITKYTNEWKLLDHKITLGISIYGFANVTAREVQKAGLILKANLKKAGCSLRLIPNIETALNTATSHHNKLGLSDNKVELLIVRNTDNKIVIAESSGAQNITALAKRDQNRPKRDARVGMLPPKLAQIIINLAVGKYYNNETGFVVLDPFCGTGVILQEAALMSYDTYGTDLSEKMIEYSKTNLEWLARTHHLTINSKLHQGDATKIVWQTPINAIASETYLGQPFSASPSPTKLAEVSRNCNYIITEFLKNIGSQIKSGVPLCLAVPAWRNQNEKFTHIPLINQLDKLGYVRHKFKNVIDNDLLYYRENQVVARELLVLVKS